MSRLQAWVLIVIAAVAVGALVQMNRYEYLVQTLDGGSSYLVKIDHLTGQQCLASLPVGVISESERRRFLKENDISPC